LKWTRKNVLVTGGSGHIGSNVVRKLVKRGVAHVRILDNMAAYPFDQAGFFLDELQDKDQVSLLAGDVCKDDDVARAIKGVDVVFHLAAYADVAATINNPDEDFRSNVAGTYSLLRHSRLQGVERYVFASSAAVYGDKPWRNRTSPPMFSEGMRPNPLSTYGNSKLWGEHEASLFHSLYGLSTTSLRYFSVYGPRQTPKTGSHSWVVAIFLMRALKRKPLRVFAGDQVRDFTYIDDIAEATVRAAEASGIDGQAFNVGTGVPTRVDRLAEMVKSLVLDRLAIEAKTEIGPRPKGDPRGGYADTRKTRRLLGFEAQVNFQEGLEETLEWVIRNKNSLPDWL
jgi:UDP-glucose 4-epimerase/dTDP-L-rhamnose 4-epimerase